MPLIRCEIVEAATGRTASFAYNCDALYEKNQPSWWREGNAFCDCNRRQFFLEAFGEYPDNIDDEEDEKLCPCGNGGYIVKELVLSDGSRFEIDQ